MKEGHEGYGVFNAFSTDMVPIPNLDSFRAVPLNSKTFLVFGTCSLIVLKNTNWYEVSCQLKVLTMYSFQINNLVWLKIKLDFR